MWNDLTLLALIASVGGVAIVAAAYFALRRRVPVDESPCAISATSREQYDQSLESFRESENPTEIQDPDPLTREKEQPPLIDIPRQRLNSSNVVSAGFDAATKIMEIEYGTEGDDIGEGRLYRYYDVDPSIFAGLMAANSPGRYVWDTIIRPSALRYECLDD